MDIIAGLSSDISLSSTGTSTRNSTSTYTENMRHQHGSSHNHIDAESITTSSAQMHLISSLDPDFITSNSTPSTSTSTSPSDLQELRRYHRDHSSEESNDINMLFGDNTELQHQDLEEIIYVSGANENDEYDTETDFGNFLRNLSSEGLLGSRTYLAFMDNFNAPEEITPDWLEDHVEFDQQGISWFLDLTCSPETTPYFSFKPGSSMCEKARSIRLKTYQGYSNIPGSRDGIDSIIDTRIESANMFKFKTTYTRPRPHLLHFQLRNLVCPVSKNEIYYSEFENDQFLIKRLNPETCDIQTVISPLNCNSSSSSSIKVSTMAANSDFVVVGGFYGEYICRRIDSMQHEQQGIDKSGVHDGLVTLDPNGITNHVCILKDKAVFSSNDRFVRTLDITTNKFLSSFEYPWAINCCAHAPGGSKLRVLVGDSLEGIIVDSETGRKVTSLTGHRDYGFACDWSGDGYTIATGNQDGTCRIYDIRNPSQSVHVIGTQLNGAIRSLSFDSSGRFLAYSEPIDYVTVVDAASDYSLGQTIELWGEISGIGFTAGVDGDAECLTIGNCDRSVGGILQYDRQKFHSSLDNDFF